MRTKYRQFSHGLAMIVGTIAVIASPESMAVGKPTEIQIDGKAALLTPQCREWQRCEGAARTHCGSDFYNAMQWRKMVEPKDKKHLGYALAFRCYPALSATPITLANGRGGWKIAPCRTEAECDKLSYATCVHGFIEREKNGALRVYPPGLEKQEEVESYEYQIECTPPRQSGETP